MSVFINCSEGACVQSKGRMELSTFLKSSAQGWKCKRCHFESTTAKDSAMSRQRFRCSGCNINLCIICGRMKLPVVEVKGGKTRLAEFKTPTILVGIPSCEATLTGAGTLYNVEVSDQTGSKWVMPKRYSDFEQLHLLLKGLTWSDSRPPKSAFPEKEVFPNVKERAQTLTAYLRTLCEDLDGLGEETQVIIIMFLRATYLSKHSTAAASSRDAAATKVSDAEVPESVSPAVSDTLTRQGSDVTGAPVNLAQRGSSIRAALRSSAKRMIVSCASCPPGSLATMSFSEYRPGPHNLKGYTRGWSCDKCNYVSTVATRSQKSSFRYHCADCSADLCVPCGDEIASHIGTNSDDVGEVESIAESISRAVSLEENSERNELSPGVESASVVKLREARHMLDEGLIDQADYDEIKKMVLSGLISTAPPF